MAIYGYGAVDPGGLPFFGATPQEAFDACQAANEIDGVPQAFAETNYIQGYGNAVFEAYGAGLPVLRLAHLVSGRGVLPTQANRLVIDRNGLDRVEFSDTENAFCIVGGSPTDLLPTHHVTIDLPGIHSSAVATGKAIYPNAVYPSTLLPAKDWEIKNSDIYASLYSLILGGLNGLRLSAVRFLGQNSGACLYTDDSGGTYGPFSGSLALLNCVARAEGPVIDLYVSNFGLELIHNSLWSATAPAVRIRKAA